VSGDREEFTVFGPTCDSVDVMPMTVRLPADLRDGDWIEFGQVGAYSNAVATAFNGFQTETFVAIEQPVERWAA
jgi:ornithine decarboxylase